MDACVQIKISGITFETSIMQDDEKRSQASGAFTSFVDTLLACAPGLKTLTLEHTRRWGDGEKANPTVGTAEIARRVCDSRGAALQVDMLSASAPELETLTCVRPCPFHTVSRQAFLSPTYTASLTLFTCLLLTAG